MDAENPKLIHQHISEIILKHFKAQIKDICPDAIKVKQSNINKQLKVASEEIATHILVFLVEELQKHFSKDSNS